MALSAKKLYYRKGGVTYSCNLYDSTADTGSPNLAVRANSQTLYAPLKTTADTNSSDLRCRKSNTTYIVQKTAGFAAGTYPPVPAGRTRYAVGITGGIFGNNRLFMVGGNEVYGGGNASWSYKVDAFNMTTQTWYVGTSTTNRGIYAACTEFSGGYLATTGEYYSTNTYEQNMPYNLQGAAATWSTLAATMYDPAGTTGSGRGWGYGSLHPYTVGGDTRYLAFRGYDQTGYRTGNDRVYSRNSATWSDAPSNFPINSYGHRVTGPTTPSTSIWASGGYGGSYLSTIYKWDGSVWTLEYTHTSAMYGRIPIYRNGFIYYFGGYDGTSYVYETLKYDVVNKTMSTLSPGPFAYIEGGALDNVGGKVYLIEGLRAPSFTTISNRMACYTIATDSWTVVGT